MSSYELKNNQQKINSFFLYSPDFWRSGYRIGAERCEKILEKELSDTQLKKLLSDMHRNECLAFYKIIGINLLYENSWKKIIELNPYGDNIILHSFSLWFEKKNELLSSDIFNYPKQLDKFVEYLKEYNADNTRQHVKRIEIIRYLLDDINFDIPDFEFGSYDDYENDNPECKTPIKDFFY